MCVKPVWGTARNKTHSCFDYDEADRRTAAHYDDGFSAYYAYDPAGNMLSARELTEGTVYFGYDQGRMANHSPWQNGGAVLQRTAGAVRNRLTSQVFAVGGAAYYAHDANSNRTELTYPSGGTAYYTYDAADRMTRVHSPSDTWTDYTFDRNGNRTKSVWGNAAYTYYTYDQADRVASIRHFDDGGAPLAYFDYGYDGRANITHIARLDGLATYYGYDAADRLASEDWKDAGGTVYAFSYDYDLNGNRTYASILGEDAYYSYDAGDRLLHFSAGGAVTYFAYDEDGNTAHIQQPAGTTYFAYNSMNMVREIKFASGTVTKLGYDARAKLAWKDVDDTPTYFGYDGLNALFEKNAAGAATAEYVYGHSDIHGIGGMTEAVVGGTRYVPEFNGVGDLVGVLDTDGNEVYRCLYDAFGRVLSETGTNPLPFGHHGPCQTKLSGGPGDPVFYLPEAGRLLWPEIGAYLSCELGEQGSGYCLHNPVRFLDPEGLAPIKIRSDAAIIAESVKELRALQKSLHDAQNLLRVAHSSYGVGSAEYKKALEEISKNRAIRALLKGIELRGQLAKLVELADVTGKLADMIEGNMTEEERAQLWGQMSEKLATKVLSRTAIGRPGAKLIIGALNTGCSLGNWTANHLASIFRNTTGARTCYRSGMSKSNGEEWCESVSSMHLFGEYIVYCYKDDSGDTYVGSAAPDAKPGDKFFATLYKIMTKDVKIVYVKCQG